MALWILLALIAIVLAGVAGYLGRPKSQRLYRRRKRPRLEQPPCGPSLREADKEWVKAEILDLWVSLKNPTSRLVADLFTRRHVQDGTTVSFTHVRRMVRGNQKLIHKLRHKAHSRTPGHTPWQLIWSADLTFRRDSLGRMHNIFSIVEHYSRACLVLEDIQEKSTIAMLRCLLSAIERFGAPARLRTDSESQFRSGLFQWTLRLLGITHERTDPYSAHQNSRVERFFGTLKRHLRRWPNAMDNPRAGTAPIPVLVQLDPTSLQLVWENSRRGLEGA